jgi:hypothetical protein
MSRLKLAFLGITLLVASGVTALVVVALLNNPSAEAQVEMPDDAGSWSVSSVQ